MTRPPPIKHKVDEIEEMFKAEQGKSSTLTTLHLLKKKLLRAIGVDFSDAPSIAL